MNVRKLFDLRGQVAVVTGGASGLGLQMAAGLAEAGANLVIASRRYELCRAVSEKLKSEQGVDALPIKFDATVENEVVDMVAGALEHFNKVDILINNVGGSIIRDTVSIPLSEWNRIIDLNLTSVFLCSREVGRHMIDRRYGKIINIASVYGLMGADWRNYVTPEKTYELLSYCTTKGGIINLTRDMAVNWAKYNINVNCISPGAFTTEQRSKSGDIAGIDRDYVRNKISYRIPMGRSGGEDDLKGAAVFLASPASRYITGHNLVVDGGWSCW